MENSVRVTPYYCKYIIHDGDDKDTYLCFFDSMNALLHFVSKMYAFDDCYDVDIVSIMANDVTLAYTGWQPGMVYEYVNTRTGEIIWHGEYPEWDH